MQLALTLLIFFGVLLSVHASAQNDAISTGFEVLNLGQRISCQRAIEEVYWSHRTWPQNSEARPNLNEILPNTAVESKVEDSLRKSNALELFWHRPILSLQLQAEIDRIERETKQPKMLREVYSALQNDPLMVAECLARPLSADRMIRQWYAYDTRFHGALEAKALSEMSRMNTVEDMKSMSGQYQEQEWKRVENNLSRDSNTIELLPEEWNEWMEEVRSQFISSPEEIRVADNSLSLIPGKISHLQQDEHRFYAIAVLSQSDEKIRLATIVWEKVPFDEWWNQVKYSISTEVKISPYPSAIQKVQWPADECVDDTWSPTPMPIVGEGIGHSAVWTGSEMIVWGGSQGLSVRLNTGARYNPLTDTWTPISTIGAPSPRYLHTAVWTGTEMIVWGGNFGLSTGGRYNPAADTWAATSIVNAPNARYGHNVVWTGSEMIVWGGRSSQLLNSGGRYNPSVDTWTPMSGTNSPEARIGHTAIWTGTEMIVWGGNGLSSYLNSGFRYDPNADVWNPITNVNTPDARAAHSVIWSGSEMIIWGGYNLTSYFNTGGRYNPATDSWTATSNVEGPSARSAPAIWTGNEMVIWGGLGCEDPPTNCSSAKLLSSGASYDPANDSWSETETIGAAFRRVGHTMVWTGSEMIIWGGGSRTGGRYNPATNQWVPTSFPEPNIPSARAEFAGIWTGAEMLVWGGREYFYFVTNTGSRYDPALNVWTEITTDSAPEGRRKHSGIWTGVEMIVWGGEKSDSYQPQNFLNTGGRYNLATGVWTQTSINSEVIPRMGHTAVWTGNQMIVWGGYTCGDPPSCTTYGPTDTGDRYDPATDTWSATTTTNSPSSRIYHTAIWTGSEMIIWGGNSFSALDTGGRYNPITDSWLLTSYSGLSARSRHSAAWTGSEMIVWGGGASLNEDVRTGARYNPINDSWTPTTNYNAPLPRNSHSAVWSGSEMIIWGGFQDNTGGRYNPTVDGWSDLTRQNVPDGRFFHVSTWTGTQMIIWGGFGGSSTGALYCALPQSCLFCDDFEDGQLASNWNYRKPVWTEIGGELIGSSVKKKAIAIADPAFGGCRTCTIDTMLQTTGGTDGKVWLSGWYCDQSTESYCEEQSSTELLMDEQADQWVLKQRYNGEIVAKAKRRKTILPNTSYAVRISFDGIHFNVFVDDFTTPMITLNPAGSIFGGTVALKVRNTSAKFGYFNIN